MPSPKRLLFVLTALFALLPAAMHADVLCTRCFHTYRAPGGADADSAGLYRIDGCVLCQEGNCDEAAALARGLRDRYETLREKYKELSKQIADLRSAGKQIPNSMIAEQARLNTDLGNLEMQYAMLDEKCPEEVPGANVWDGLYPGPVEESPVTIMNDAARAARIANQASERYDQLANREQQQIDAIVGFFNNNPDVSSPPPGYNGERYRTTRSYQELARAYRREAKILTDGTDAPDPKVDLANPIVPKFPEIKLANGDEAYIRNAGIAARARLEGNAYILAELQAREMYRQSLAAGNRDAAKLHARSAVEFAWQAQGYAKWAADHQLKSDSVHQKLLDASLVAAAKEGLTLAVLLEKFQSRIKESGLPAHLNEALTEIEADADERAAIRVRLLALTPEAVEAVLNERRARIGRGAEVPDASIRDTSLMASQKELVAP